jgi:hypothetical protein
MPMPPTQSYVQEHQLAIAEVAEPVPVARSFMEPESDAVSAVESCPTDYDEHLHPAIV